jgi:hypothetical protein
VVSDKKTRDGNGLVLNNIIDSFTYFKTRFTQTDNNFMNCPIYCNGAFGYGRGLQNKLDDTFFNSQGNNVIRNILLTLTWSDLVNNGVFSSREEILIRFNINLSREKYNILKQAYQISVRKYLKEGNEDTTIVNFLKSFKRGSKKFRIIMEGTVCDRTVSTGSHVTTFLRNIDVVCPSIRRVKALYSNWNVSFLNSNIREFSFKYYNNILGLNSRVAHFNREVNAGCTFCYISNNRPVPKESMLHLFYFCPTVSKIVSTFYEKYTTNLENNKTNYFLSDISPNERVNNVLNIVWDVFRYVIWQFKLKKQVPIYGIFDEEINYQFAIINSVSTSFRDALIDCPFLQTNQPRRPLPDHNDERRP